MMRIASAAVMILVSLPCVGFAAEHVVRPDGSGDFPTIQSAVDAAAEGDTILLDDGVFTGNGNRDIKLFGKDLVIRSMNGANACTIDSQGAPGAPHRAFRLDAGETQATRIEGIKIVGGYVQGPFPECGGGGILVAYNSHPTITQCIFEDNETGFEGFGAGILAWENCDITLTDCTFVNNVSGWYGGGFTLRKDCDGIVERCLVQGNYALHAGGGASITNSDPQVTDCQFLGNWCTEAGGGGVLIKAGAVPTFTRCTFSGNLESGIGIGNDPIVTAIDCLFEGNGDYAILVDAQPNEINLLGCTFVNNSSQFLAHDVFLNSQSSGYVRNCIFRSGCLAAPFAIYVAFNASLDIDCSIVENGRSGVGGTGTVAYGTGNLDADPLFCDAGACASPVHPSGDFHLQPGSPASPENNGCGVLLGAYPVACGATPAGVELERDSWGRIKATFRAH